MGAASILLYISQIINHHFQLYSLADNRGPILYPAICVVTVIGLIALVVGRKISTGVHRVAGHPINMFSSKQKKVHYAKDERGTKGSKPSHSHRSTGSRDSGFGSSSASDRASLGTSPEKDSPYGIVEDQRNDISAVQNALRAANEKIRRLEAANAHLDQELMDSNKENRALRREKGELLESIKNLEDDLADEKKANERFRRDTTPRTGAAAPSGTRTERRSTPPKKETRESEPRRRVEEVSQGGRNDRRSSWREQPLPHYERPIYTERPPAAPYAPSTNAPNPFSPIPTSDPNPFLPNPNSARPPSMAYTPSSISYSAAPVTYTTAPAFPPRTGSAFPNDGKYHPYPLQ